jgi:hypothetical protein
MHTSQTRTLSQESWDTGITGRGPAYASAVNLAMVMADKEAEVALMEEGRNVSDAPCLKYCAEYARLSVDVSLAFLSTGQLVPASLS